MSKLEQTRRKHLKYNIAVNVLDGAFFGLGWGCSSFGTIIPLFVSRLTQSATLIGLIPAIHGVGWQLPQLFMANAVARRRRYKPMVLWLMVISGGKINPLIGACGISAFPMAGRLSARMAQEEDFDNFILMHAMGSNTAGQLGSVIAGGVLLALVAQMM